MFFHTRQKNGKKESLKSLLALHSHNVTLKFYFLDRSTDPGFQKAPAFYASLNTHFSEITGNKVKPILSDHLSKIRKLFQSNHYSKRPRALSTVVICMYLLYLTDYKRLAHISMSPLMQTEQRVIFQLK